MKVSRLYSSKPDVFEPIEFTAGLNVVLGEIRLPENRNRDTHNLGKTTLGSMIDYCLLATRDNEFFLFKQFQSFKDFVFFFEVELLDGTYLTIRRGVEDATKISFKKHLKPRQDFTYLPESAWDHFDVPFERAKELLDGLLDLQALKPWSYRKGLGYLVRSQEDFADIFRLKKFKSAQSDWKPYLAHLLGFNAETIESHYKKEEELIEKESAAQTIKAELGGAVQNLSKIEGMLLLKRKDAERRQAFLDAFDFRAQDKRKTKELVDEIDARIAELNMARYSLTQNRKKVLASLENGQILFDPDEAERLFDEAGVLFKGQIKHDFQQLIAFNKAVTEERQQYLQEERNEIESELKRINSELNELGKKRSSTISYLSGSDIFSKYKQITDELVNLKADIASLERQRKFLLRLQELRKEISVLREEKDHLRRLIEEDVDKQRANPQSLFSSTLIYFSDIVEEVIDRKALLSVVINKEGHLEFKADILDESGNATSAAGGHSYKKLLCIAFDMAIVRAHLDEKFPRFIFHDGVFESLDDRKKENLISVIRKYCEIGIQHIITLIDSDLPAHFTDDTLPFKDEEIILRLHDEGEPGRLFKMRPW
jgi:uncharacterized protein YydD (DUF2326 family)